MRTIQKTVYTFNELNKTVQEKVINNFRENSNSDDFEFEQESILDYWKEKLQDIGFNDAKISFTGFYSQGDGASFTTKDIDMDKVINAMIICDRLMPIQAQTYLNFLHLENKGYLYLGYDISRISHHYSHENTIQINDNSEFELDGSSKAHDYFNSFFDELKYEVKIYVKELCRAIYMELCNTYEFCNSEEYIMDFIINNEFEFYKDGTQY